MLYREEIKEVNKRKIAIIFLIIIIGKAIVYRNDFSALNNIDLWHIFVLPFFAFLLGAFSQKIFRFFYKVKPTRHAKHGLGSTPQKREDKADDETLNFAIFWTVVGCLVFIFE